jgi:alanyl-tRNA synthetase
LSGEQAFDLYATYGLPLEITRDIAREQNLDVDEQGFRAAMEEHRLASGAGEVFGVMGGEDVDVYRRLLKELQTAGKLDAMARANPTNGGRARNPGPGGEGRPCRERSLAKPEVLRPRPVSGVESGGQVSDTGGATSPMVAGNVS